MRELVPTILFLVTLAGPAAAQCPNWEQYFNPQGMAGTPGSGSNVRSAEIHDDGSGPALYLAGKVAWAGGTKVERIARWDGAAFSAVGEGITGLNPGGEVYALRSYDDGSGPALYAAGNSFSDPFVRRWDGSAWSPVGDPSWTGTEIQELVAFDDGTGTKLYASGRLLSNGSTSFPIDLARWDGTAWEAVPATGIVSTSDTDALAVFDDGSGPALYVGGRFFLGTSSVQVMRWDGVAWSTVGALGGTVPAMAVFGGELHAISTYSLEGPVVRWDGSAWSSLGSPGYVGAPISLGVHDDGNGPALYLGGSLTSVAGQGGYEGLARWDGAAWSKPGGVTGSLLVLQSFDAGGGPLLYVGGSFDTADGQPALNVARLNGTLEPFGPGVPLDAPVRALAVHDDGSGPALYVGGEFQSAGGQPVAHVGRWHDGGFEALGAGLPGTVLALAEHDDGSGLALYAGGDFPSLGSLARWDGASWTAAGWGSTGRVLALRSFGGRLYAGGQFTDFGGSGKHLASWDGSAWSIAGGGTDQIVRALEVYDDGSGAALYVAGNVRNVGVGLTQPVDFVARWDGAQWTPLATGLDGPVHDLAVHDDGSGPGLVLVGDFTQSLAPSSSPHVARYDGAWHALGAGILTATRAVLAHDEGLGEGETLYVGMLNGNSVPRFKGGTWQYNYPGFGGEVSVLARFSDGPGAWPALFIGGAGGVSPTQYLGRWASACACQGSSYCTAGTTASGCTASVSSTGAASRSAASGFAVTVTDVEGPGDGTMYVSTNGSQAAPWGNGTSFQCVTPPVTRLGLLPGTGTPGNCDGGFQLDFNAWMSANPGKAPAAGDTAYLQCWFRDPFNTSNQTTSLSDALRFSVCP